MALVQLACSASAPATPPGADGPVEPAAVSAGVAQAPESVRSVFAKYEAMRAALARDAVSEAPAGAEALAAAARAAAPASKPEQKAQWDALGAAADALKVLPASDADGVRKGFGEVSRALVAVLAADAALAEGLHVFKCPMAQGYQKWVQPDSKLANPYMGTQMLTCGSETDLK
jgi:hypothetical protein